MTVYRTKLTLDKKLAGWLALPPWLVAGPAILIAGIAGVDLFNLKAGGPRLARPIPILYPGIGLTLIGYGGAYFFLGMAVWRVEVDGDRFRYFDRFNRKILDLALADVPVPEIDDSGLVTTAWLVIGAKRYKLDPQWDKYGELVSLLSPKPV